MFTAKKISKNKISVDFRGTHQMICYFKILFPKKILPLHFNVKSYVSKQKTTSYSRKYIHYRNSCRR
ncbi:hypothetical protein TRIP_D440161 [uncultured Paludibacter sp.]|uniref:Uncharacterized protein n=1 Tax=uncultured Paludibacter sp. TaxID=497635 RepID=A0A653AJA0_9BACT|nr:hypothetical protein TRIP_D440161 [uncultured Paludibacter sp.]